MRTRRSLYFLPLLSLLFISFSAKAANIISKGGAWNQTSTWEGGVIPTSTDSVVINGNEVIVVDLSVTVARIHIINYDINTGIGSEGRLKLMGNTIMICNGELYVQGEGKNKHLELHMQDLANLEVKGHLNFQRHASNSDDKMVRLHMNDDAQLIARAGFTFNYHNSDGNEWDKEILLTDNAGIDVYGLTEFYQQNGNEFWVELKQDSRMELHSDFIATLNNGGEMYIEPTYNSHFTVHGNTQITNNGGGIVEFALYGSGDATFEGDLELKSTLINKKVLLEAHDINNDFFTGGAVKLITDYPNTVEIKLNSYSDLYLEGNLERTNGYGKLTMSDDATLFLNGTTPQTLPNTTAFGPDSLDISNMEVNNTSGSLTLGGPFKIVNNLELIDGKIFTTATNILIVEDQVDIIGGNTDAYIDGPVQKIGRNNGNPFTFPLGKNGIYAPLTISSVSQAESKYTAQYFRAIPQNPDSLALGLNNISNLEYWEFDIDPGTSFAGPELVDVTMGWTDADNSGINDLADLVVARYNDVTGEWMNTGNGGTTGSAGSGQAGTLTHDNSCPPPCCHSILTYGSITADNPLPIELNYLTVEKIGDQVAIDWMTNIETDMDKFEVERSFDGYQFSAIDEVKASTTPNFNQYQSIDAVPQEGDNYYRIKMIDLQGEIKYTPIALVNFEEFNKLDIFPNPVTDNFQLMGSEDFKGNSKVEVFNQVGKRVYIGSYNLENVSTTLYTADLNITRPGLYFLYITNNNKVSIVNFVKEEE